MAKPIHHIKDSDLFTTVINNFESFIDGRLHKRMVGYSGGTLWYLFYKIVNHEQVPTLKASVSQGSLCRTLEVHYGISINGPPTVHRESLKSGQLGPTESFPLDESSRDLTVRVEVRVDVIIDNNGPRKFNFNDPFEGCVTFSHREWNTKFWVSKQLIAYHSPVFAKEISEGKREIELSILSAPYEFERFLQVLHGVHFDYDANQIDYLSQIAHLFKADYVLRHLGYKDQILTKQQVDSYGNVKELQEFMKKKDGFLMEMKTEVLKAIVKKFFSFAVDFNKRL